MIYKCWRAFGVDAVKNARRLASLTWERTQVNAGPENGRGLSDNSYVPCVLVITAVFPFAPHMQWFKAANVFHSLNLRVKRACTQALRNISDNPILSSKITKVFTTLVNANLVRRQIVGLLTVWQTFSCGKVLGNSAHVTFCGQWVPRWLRVASLD